VAGGWLGLAAMHTCTEPIDVRVMLRASFLSPYMQLLQVSGDNTAPTVTEGMEVRALLHRAGDSCLLAHCMLCCSRSRWEAIP